MKKLLFCTILLLCSNFIFGQNIKNKYSSHSNEQGTVYFIYPMKGLKNKDIPSNLEYDLTYNSATDSVTYNFTFYNKVVSPVESIYFDNPDQKFEAEMLFVEPHKNDWKLRVSVKLPFEFVKVIYSSKTSYKLFLNTEKGIYEFNQSEKSWQKQADIINKIFDVIKYNVK